MKIIKILLTAFYSIFTVVGLVNIIIGKVHVALLLYLFALVATGMAVNGKGGNVFRNIAFFVVASLILSFITVLLPLFGEPVELPLLVFSVICVLAGLGTSFCLVKGENHENITDMEPQKKLTLRQNPRDTSNPYR